MNQWTADPSSSYNDMHTKYISESEKRILCSKCSKIERCTMDTGRNKQK